MPIVGIARSPIGIEGLRERVRASLVVQGIFDAGTELIANRAPESDGQTAWGPATAADLISGNAENDGWHDPESAESNPH